MASQTLDGGARRARTMKYGTNMVIGVLLMLVALVAVNYAVRVRPTRFDLTQGKQYTLSSATERLLGMLKDNVTITVYASTKDVPPDWRRQREELLSLLSEYRQVSKRRVNFTVKDASDEKVQEQAQKANIEAQQMSQVGSQSLSLAVGYLGFVVQYLGKSETVPALRPSSSIEYQLTRAINKVAQLDKPVVAVLSSQPEQDPMAMMRGQMPPQSAFSLLPQVLEGEGYEVKTISPTRMNDLTTAVKMLYVMQDQPEDLPEEALYRIDQFVMNGGKLFVAAGGLQLSGGQRGGIRGTPKAPNINSILDNYGLRINGDVVEDWERGSPNEVFTGTRIVSFMDPFQNRVTDLAKDNDITKPLPGVLLMYPSSVGRSSLGTSGTISVLARSSERSRKQDGMLVLDPLRLTGKTPKLGDPGVQSFDLISMVQGPITSRFASVDPPAITIDDQGTTRAVQKSEVLTTAKAGAAVVVAGSGISFSDMVLGRGAQINAVLLQNAADAMTRGGAMTALRAKQQHFATLREITDTEERWAKILAIGAVPLLVIGFGMLKLALNARRKARYRQMYSRRESGNQTQSAAA